VKGATVVLVAISTIALACGGPPPPPPSAVITADPERLCAGDDYKTLIHLDAKASAPRLTLVATRPDPSELPLTYAWTFAGSAYTVEEGDPSADTMAVRVAADRPLHVTLRVENKSGGVAEAEHTIAIVLPDANGQCTP
jgi:hypothetical protein